MKRSPLYYIHLFILFFPLFPLSSGCSFTHELLRQEVRVLEMEPLIIESSPDGHGVFRVLDAPSLFEMAGKEQEFLDCDKAMRYYDLLIDTYPDSPYIWVALYNSALCLEFNDKLDEAEKRYRKILEKGKKTEVYPDAFFRIGLLLEKKGRYRESLNCFKKVLKLKGLNREDSAVALAQYGVELANLRRYRKALKVLTMAEKRLNDLNGESEYLSYFRAKLHLKKGEIFINHLPKIKLKGRTEKIEENLKLLSRIFMSAKEEFRLSIKERVPEFMVEALFRAGEGYEILFSSLNNAPIPPELNEEEAKVYSELLLKKTSPILRESIDIYSNLVTLGDIFGHDNPFIKKGKERLRELESSPFLREQD